MQSKTDEANESFYWYLKTLKEQEQKRMSSKALDEMSSKAPDEMLEFNILRFVKLLEPTVERLLEICEKELNISLLTASSILEKLEKSKQIQIVESPDPAKTDKIVKLTENGLQTLKDGG